MRDQLLHITQCRTKPGGGVFPYKRLLGMCRWMGSHFHDWSDHNGVANFQILGVSRDSKWEDSLLKNQKVVVY